jgi:hypothetical protein
VIKLCVVTGDAVFEDEANILCPAKPANSISVPLRMKKPMNAELSVQCIIGNLLSPNNSVAETTISMSKFAHWYYCKPREVANAQPRGCVSFSTGERVNRVLLWLHQLFPMDPTQNNVYMSVTPDSLHAAFLSCRDGSPLIMRMTSDQNGRMELRCDDMETCANIITDLCNYVKLTELSSVCDFPLAFAELEATLNRVEQFNAARKQMGVDMADSSQAIKMSVIQAEDAFAMLDMDYMLTNYRRAMDRNAELIREYKKRYNNQEELLLNLKEVNRYIQSAANLRLGKAKEKIIALCRQAIKQNNYRNLVQIMKTGGDK